MNTKRPFDEVTSCSEAKKPKTINCGVMNNCPNEELEREMKLLNISFPIDLEEIKEKKIFHEASEKGYVHVVKELLKLKMNVDDKDDDEVTALHLASENGHASIVAELLAHGANPELQNGDVCRNCHYCGSGTNALHLASEYGHVEVAKELLKYKPDLSKKGGRHYNALQIACDEEHVEIVKLLLANGADVKGNGFSDRDIELPIFITTKNGNLAIFKELLKYGADPFEKSNDEEEFTAIKVASENEHLNIVEEALLSGDIDAADNDGLTRLQHASVFGHYEIVVKLLERGCKVNVTSPSFSSFTALHFAVLYEHLEIAEKLLQHGANPNIQDKMGKTALHLALEEVNAYLRWRVEPYKCVRIVEILLNNGNMDINIKNKNGKTVLQLAIELSMKNKEFNDVARMIAKKACLKPRIFDSIYPMKNLM